MACDLHLFICNALLRHLGYLGCVLGCFLTVAVGLQELWCLGCSALLQPITCPSTRRSESPRELATLNKGWLSKAGWSTNVQGCTGALHCQCSLLPVDPDMAVILSRWTPPNYTFPLVWTSLKLAQSAALWLVWKSRADKAELILPLSVFGLHLGLGNYWNVVSQVGCAGAPQQPNTALRP